MAKKETEEETQEKQFRAAWAEDAPGLMWNSLRHIHIRLSHLEAAVADADPQLAHLRTIQAILLDIRRDLEEKKTP